MRSYAAWRRAVFFCVAVGIAGCANRSSLLPKDARFDARGSADKAIVIVGFAASRYDTFLGMTATLGDLGLSWVKTSYGGQGLPASLDQRFTVPRKYCQPLLGLPDWLAGSSDDLCNQTHRHRFVLSAAPGDYRLAQLGRVQQAGPLIRSYATRFKGKPLTIHLDPGEIVYLGDFVFDAVAFPAQRVSDARDDAGARAALEEFKGVHGAMTFRAPMIDGSDPLLTNGAAVKLEAE